MTIRQPHSGLRSIAVLSLTALFFMLAMGITITATGVYRSIAAVAEQHFSQRTAISYVVNAIRQGEGAGAVSVSTFGNGDALYIDDVDGYRTLLYCWNGNLMEVYADASLSLSPEDGQILLEAQALSLEYTNDLLTITVTNSDGSASTVSLSPRCERKEVSGS